MGNDMHDASKHFRWGKTFWMTSSWKDGLVKGNCMKGMYENCPQGDHSKLTKVKQSS